MSHVATCLRTKSLGSSMTWENTSNRSGHFLFVSFYDSMESNRLVYLLAVRRRSCFVAEIRERDMCIYCFLLGPCPELLFFDNVNDALYIEHSTQHAKNITGKS